MKLISVIGSPRGKKSNSTVISDWFNQEPSETLYLNKIKQHLEYVKTLKDATHIVFIFPLYVDGMPAQVKAFFEEMEKVKLHFVGKKVTYIIHSGFPDGIHLENLKKYLNYYSKLMSFKNYGVICIPGSEGFRLMPENMTKKKSEIVSNLGQQFIKNQAFPDDALVKLQGPLRFSKMKITGFKLASGMGLTNFYWNSNLKKNDAYHKRFDQPYA